MITQRYYINYVHFTNIDLKLEIKLDIPNYRKDARLPVQLQRAMAAEAEAAREARAKVIAAEGEQKASRALKEASEIIAESSSALQLRYLQVHLLQKIFAFSAQQFFLIESHLDNIANIHITNYYHAYSFKQFHKVKPTKICLNFCI